MKHEIYPGYSQPCHDFEKTVDDLTILAKPGKKIDLYSINLTIASDVDIHEQDLVMKLMAGSSKVGEYRFTSVDDLVSKASSVKEISFRNLMLLRFDLMPMDIPKISIASPITSLVICLESTNGLPLKRTSRTFSVLLETIETNI